MAESTAALVRRFYAALDAGHGAAVAPLVTPDFVAHLAGRPALGGDAFAAALDGLYAAFPDLRHELLEVVAEGDRAAARLVERGTHRGPFQGIAPTGRTLAVPALAFHRFADGRLAELWLLVDGLARTR